jgi:hypothetical protein
MNSRKLRKEFIRNSSPLASVVALINLAGLTSPALHGRGQRMMRRVLLLVTVALVMATMMVATATSAFAAPKGGQTPENSCGAAGGFSVPPGLSGEPFGDCGYANNPIFEVPPGNQ